MSEWRPGGTPFLRRFPDLAARLPHTPIGVFPTPLRVLDELPSALGAVDSLYLKDDGVSNARYGGNKVRKLELVLGDALRSGAREVMTFGFAGSNHAAATAVHAAALGLGAISMLLPQSNAPYVATNLAVSAAVGAELHYYRTVPGLAAGVVQQTGVHQLRTGKRPFVIAPGGSSPLGTVGFVAAAFELADQLEQQALPPPDVVYVPLGSGGTAVGLGLGFAAAGLPTTVVAVRVTELKHANERKVTKLWRETVELLRGADSTFPAVWPDNGRLSIRHDCFGDGYAVPTPLAREAINLMQSRERIVLDVAYTGKTLGCLMSDARQGALAGKRVLFWNTYNTADLSMLSGRVTPEEIPTNLRSYLTRP
jgi:1-aminocyclopropane-1-carboxylate deaminase/D-cysteine desulfhydrase-like pyridoxal-dependent ACC family enzyme